MGGSARPPHPGCTWSRRSRWRRWLPRRRSSYRAPDRWRKPVWAVSGQSDPALPAGVRFHRSSWQRSRLFWALPWRRRGRCPASGSRLYKPDSRDRTIWSEPEVLFLRWASYYREYRRFPRCTARNICFPGRTAWTFPCTAGQCFWHLECCQSWVRQAGHFPSFSESCSRMGRLHRSWRRRLRWPDTFLPMSQIRRR